VACVQPLLPLVLRRVRQRALVVEDVAQITAIDPAVASGAAECQPFALKKNPAEAGLYASHRLAFLVTTFRS
jgi:hypothetical protein